MNIKPNSVNVSVPFYFVDDVGGTNPGEPTTGLLFSDIETGGYASYQRQGAAVVDITLVTQTAAGAHVDGGFVLLDDTKQPGNYRLDIPDAAVASGVNWVIIYLIAAAGKNTITRPLKIDLATHNASVVSVDDDAFTNDSIEDGAFSGMKFDQTFFAKFSDTDTGETVPVAGSVAKLSQSDAAGAAGPGDTAYPVTLTDPDSGLPVPDVGCWVSTDIAGANVVAGTLYTDDTGTISSPFMLDSGTTYYLWRSSATFKPAANPTAFTVP